MYLPQRALLLPVCCCYRHILVAVGADRMLRFWECFSGALLCEHFTAHQQGESVAALALAPDNSTLVTADTAGYIMVSVCQQLREQHMKITCRIASVCRAASVAVRGWCCDLLCSHCCALGVLSCCCLCSCRCGTSPACASQQPTEQHPAVQQQDQGPAVQCQQQQQAAMGAAALV
jgi:hypothetical protein